MPTPTEYRREQRAIHVAKERARLHTTIAAVNFNDIRQQWRALSGRMMDPAPFTPAEYRERLHALCMGQEQRFLRNLSRALQLKEGLL